MICPPVAVDGSGDGRFLLRLFSEERSSWASISTLYPSPPTCAASGGDMGPSVWAPSDAPTATRLWEMSPKMGKWCQLPSILSAF